MGLDITAYSNLGAVGKHTAGWCEDDNHVVAIAYDSFPDSFRGIPVLSTETHSGATFLMGGCYALTDTTEMHGFQAGSYSGYNAWRADLQRQFNPDRDPAEPFYELIWFADNEGSIGPEAAADLLKDFEQHAAEYRPGDYGDYFREKYADWTRAFQLAAVGGLVRFH
jgi:hypothetical protein